ncbi:uncharacterized protein FOMMEDRAFT_161422 [Fomitiporia mediterranea MF3/22]|uniref:uncharacterized protein n=1 Tax=Fomitiporia mediterranea (strain MF3/22) TaxID=694068 RepID=UPI00044072F0|nr:uncharacterized protein FOMMEDRAFT_161422 [Fomitiporia mediterranea MF3/22]EJC98604.1 hypothetical protein FOMMEDRAFT_161422 [Fomitiporia mediterranea MF3/22]
MASQDQQQNIQHKANKEEIERIITASKEAASTRLREYEEESDEYKQASSDMEKWGQWEEKFKQIDKNDPDATYILAWVDEKVRTGFGPGLDRWSGPQEVQLGPVQGPGFHKKSVLVRFTVQQKPVWTGPGPDRGNYSGLANDKLCKVRAFARLSSVASYSWELIFADSARPGSRLTTSPSQAPTAPGPLAFGDTRASLHLSLLVPVSETELRQFSPSEVQNARAIFAARRTAYPNSPVNIVHADFLYGCTEFAGFVRNADYSFVVRMAPPSFA